MAMMALLDCHVSFLLPGSLGCSVKECRWVSRVDRAEWWWLASSLIPPAGSSAGKGLGAAIARRGCIVRHPCASRLHFSLPLLDR